MKLSLQNQRHNLAAPRHTVQSCVIGKLIATDAKLADLRIEPILLRQKAELQWRKQKHQKIVEERKKQKAKAVF